MGKVYSLDVLLKQREQWRQEGKTVVFTNGCFDLLHVGHVRSIEEAAVLGDILIAGLNSDRSVRQLKGEGRPLLDEKNRGEVVAALRWVDAVVFFDEPTADATLEKLKPDIHAKGTDYTSESVPERETVLRYGGRIAITGDPKNHSTKNLIREIQTRYRGGK
jgi:D-glycero-beta-D-manno-heptose 1-phosphate adenylyltransferase